MNSASPILSKLRSYARTLKVWGHPSTELKSEKREIERHEVKPQDTIPGPMKFSLGQRPSAGLKSEKQEIERYEIKYQWTKLNEAGESSDSVSFFVQRDAFQKNLIKASEEDLRL